MIFHHDPQTETLDLSPSISGHSGNETVCYKTVNGQQVLLSRYLPPGFEPGRMYPALFLIHGGAWYSRMIFPDQAGWQGDYLGFLARYFAEQGMATFSIDYRLADEDGQAEGHQIADCCQDCLDAVTFLLDHASEFGIDPNRVSPGRAAAEIRWDPARRDNPAQYSAPSARRGWRSRSRYNGIPRDT